MIDITIPMRAGMAVWPGDTEYALTQNRWGSALVGAVTMSLHTGTHADAPSHFLPDGASIEAQNVSVFVGECLVVDAVGHEFIGPELFPDELPPRVLVKTLAWTDHTLFPARVPTLTREAVESLAARGVALVGVDVPSVDAIDSINLPVHHALARSNIQILESLDLRNVTPGAYRLIALPLALVGGDASPVRAVLIERTGS